MWKTKVGQVSFRLSEEQDVTEINEIAEKLQIELNTVFESGRELLKALISKVNSLENQTAELQNQILESLKPNEISEEEPKDNILIIELVDNPSRKKALLTEISRRRAKKLGSNETIEELAEKLIFNDNSIFNLGGEFYTGF